MITILHKTGRVGPPGHPVQLARKTTPVNTVDVAVFSGTITSAARGREVQLALKLTF
jgi:hypothetical protein